MKSALRPRITARYTTSSAERLRRREVHHGIGPGWQLERHARPSRRWIEPLRCHPPRLLEGVHGFEIAAGQCFTDEDARRRGVSPLEHQLALGIEIAIQ